MAAEKDGKKLTGLYEFSSLAKIEYITKSIDKFLDDTFELNYKQILGEIRSLKETIIDQIHGFSIENDPSFRYHSS